jgi:hypothetical protein
MRGRDSFLPIVTFRRSPVNALPYEPTDSDEVVLHLKDIVHMKVEGGLCYLATSRIDYQLSVADYDRIKKLWGEYETLRN